VFPGVAPLAAEATGNIQMRANFNVPVVSPLLAVEFSSRHDARFQSQLYAPSYALAISDSIGIKEKRETEPVRLDRRRLLSSRNGDGWGTSIEFSIQSLAENFQNCRYFR
jgi:hypothetical protein